MEVRKGNKGWGGKRDAEGQRKQEKDKKRKKARIRRKEGQRRGSPSCWRAVLPFSPPPSPAEGLAALPAPRTGWAAVREAGQLSFATAGEAWLGLAWLGRCPCGAAGRGWQVSEAQSLLQQMGEA